MLRRDLDILVGQLEMEPESVLPHHRFLKSFQIPEVHSAMSMLFPFPWETVAGHRQIGEPIDRNLEMLDVAEKGRLKNLSSGMYLLFLAPVLTASLKTSCGYGSVYDDISVRGRTWIKGRRIQNEPDHKGIHGSIPDSFYGGDSNGNSGSLYMEVMNAQDMQARIVDEIENSDFNTGVVQQCFCRVRKPDIS